MHAPKAHQLRYYTYYLIIFSSTFSKPSLLYACHSKKILKTVFISSIRAKANFSSIPKNCLYHPIKPTLIAPVSTSLGPWPNFSLSVHSYLFIHIFTRNKFISLIGYSNSQKGNGRVILAHASLKN